MATYLTGCTYYYNLGVSSGSSVVYYLIVPCWLDYVPEQATVIENNLLPTVLEARV